MRILLGGLAVGLAAIGMTVPDGARASDGALEINQACVATGCFSGDSGGYPVLVTQPGRYLLTSNLLANGPGVTAISIAASPVELDLGGFTIDGGSSCTGYPVASCTGSTSANGILVSGTNRVTRIRNGTVRGFDTGIELGSAQDGTVLEDLAVSDNRADGIFISAPAPSATLVRRVVATRNFDNGLAHLNPGRLVVRESLFSGNGDGADVTNARAVFLDNQFIFNFFAGIRCQGICMLGRNAFLDNNSASSTDEFTITTLRDMGGNVCEDGACP